MLLMLVCLRRWSNIKTKLSCGKVNKKKELSEYKHDVIIIQDSFEEKRL